MTSTPLLTTAFHDWHVAHGGRMVEFGGWHMPVQYSTIVEEHLAVRSAAGVFDIAHMGRLKFSGPDAERLLNHLLTVDVTRLSEGQVRYSLVTNEQGGILDDVLVYRLPEHWLLVVNASNRLKIVRWIESHRAGFDARVDDLTLTHPMLAVQGPRAVDVIRSLGCPDAAALKYYRAAWFTLPGPSEPVLVSRTGYTGEDGFELIVLAESAVEIWEAAVAAGQPVGLHACGLGCRDTLRLEAAMPLYGHELSESIDPLTAGLDFAVHLDKDGFIGQAALRDRRDQPTGRVRVGLKLDGRRIAREGSAVLLSGQPVGEVTSGTFSPTLEQAIAMAYVESAQSGAGTRLEVDIRGRTEPARVVPLPFYRRPKEPRS